MLVVTWCLLLPAGWRESLFALPKRLFSAVTLGADISQLDQQDGVSLPKLPVPSLDHTLERYLAAVKPLVTEAKYERTRVIVKAFGSSNQAARLQDKLLDRRETMDNWAYQWWQRDMYLAVKLPLPINSNPGYVLPPRNFQSAQDMARFAARMVARVLQHKQILDRKELVVERASSREKGQPLCMAQYYRLLSSYRSPGVTTDVIVSRLGDRGEKEGGRSTPPPQGEHVIVSCRNKMYWLPVVLAEQTVSEDQLTGELLAVMRDAHGSPSTPPVGLLTAERRDTWATARQRLCQDERNARSLKLIEKSLMMVCLDEPLSTTFNSSEASEQNDRKGLFAGSRDETNMAHQMIHGGGSAANSANRWFDLTLQLVVSPDGVCGVCYEHSPAEGVAVVQLVEEVLRKVDAASVSEAPVPVSARPALAVRLEWVVDHEVDRVISQAAEHLDRLVEDLDLYVYRYVNYGKNFIKSCKVSPDAYIQLALQLTYYRLYRHLVATYESASTRRYLLGRVDCIRSATSEALEWASAMCQDESDGRDDSDEDGVLGVKRVTFSLYTEEQKLELFETAMKKQTEIMVDNIMGQGIDIHLLGLREMAREMGEPIPELFKDEVYRIANHFALSTSQVATTLESVMGYGPVVPDGYGASYNPKPDSIVFCLSAFKSCDHTSTGRFARGLEESLDAMQRLLSLPPSK